MGQYHNQKLSTSKTTTTDSPAQPTLVSVVKSTPMRFKIQDSVYNQKSTWNTSIVEAEFQKYALDLISSKGTDIIWFWKVGNSYD